MAQILSIVFAHKSRINSTDSHALFCHYCVSNAHTPKAHFQKVVSSLRKSSLVIWTELKQCHIKIALNSSAYMQKNLQTVQAYLKANNLLLQTEFWYCFLFWKQCLRWVIRKQIFDNYSMLLSVRKMSKRSGQRLSETNAKNKLSELMGWWFFHSRSCYHAVL